MKATSWAGLDHGCLEGALPTWAASSDPRTFCQLRSPKPQARLASGAPDGAFGSGIAGQPGLPRKGNPCLMSMSRPAHDKTYAHTLYRGARGGPSTRRSPEAGGSPSRIVWCPEGADSSADVALPIALDAFQVPRSEPVHKAEEQASSKMVP
ncbi:hypothetical protein CSOJ01_05186 [Colletotrichum sojae]|uniref:Uncharacterized protein n=1 Tax=Colletotrichum sojae TaxID=2175907 RepID=A0A8H6JGR0_9PEZI|nr:hypothetical protein CSOJ01_05186 [Colletotrichum sojae]